MLDVEDVLHPAKHPVRNSVSAKTFYTTQSSKLVGTTFLWNSMVCVMSWVLTLKDVLQSPIAGILVVTTSARKPFTNQFR